MKVWPTSEELRAVLAHPIGGKFRDSGYADWPDDTYTYRRIQEGSVVTVDPAAPPAEPAPAPPPPEPEKPKPERAIGPLDATPSKGGKSKSKT